MTDTISHREQARDKYQADHGYWPEDMGLWDAGYDAALVLADDLAESSEAINYAAKPVKVDPETVTLTYASVHRLIEALAHYRAARQ